MKNIHRIDTIFDPIPFLEEISSPDGVWDETTCRQDKIKVQCEAREIPIRGLRESAIRGRKRRDVHESQWTQDSTKYPHARRFLEQFADAQDCLLGRAKIVCLPAEKRVFPHIDVGHYYLLRDRYHFILQAVAGSRLTAEDEEVRMQEGEVWWFDNKKMHEVYCDGEQCQIHMIFDLLPNSLAKTVFDYRIHSESADSVGWARRCSHGQTG